MNRSAVSVRLRATFFLAVLAVVLPGASCEVVKPSVKAVSDVPSAGKFPHGLLGRLLDKVVVADGLVDYAAVSVDERLLEEYLAEIARVSPESHPHLFPTEPDRLAYWINAHNACALRGVLRFNRPGNLKDIAHRFDSETTYVVGGKNLSLNAMTSLAYRRFTDARIHFALVKARRGGPPLAKEPWDPADLDARLDAAARAFLADPRNVDWRPPALKAGLSRILLDFRAEFEREVPSTVSGDSRLISSLNRFRAQREKINAIEVYAIPLDERLNDLANR
ncbi:MAG TPA: DUF547 domain-containing protein [Thermoanaerobaculia bacterium]|nr:DUF547 domain-containing protein [Thermoanaerobaculia bacterium]